MGLMSGTSLDGVDACLAKVSFWPETLTLKVAQVQHQHRPYPTELKQELLALQEPKATLTLAHLTELHYSLGERYAEAALQLLTASGLKREAVFVVGCHGQTVYHQPPSASQLGRTLQLGEPSFIAQATGCPTVSDFRPADMSVGGQGAPLVPFADLLLFADATKGRCIQNLGGIGNVTALPPLNSQQDLIAFDTGPANMLLDEACRRYFQQPCDWGGQLAASGQVDPVLLSVLQQHPYFTQQPPKSTGRELFGASFLDETLLSLKNKDTKLSPQDIIATLTDFTAWSVADAYERFIWPHQAIDEVILGGGGTYNPTLVSRLQFYLGQSAQRVGQACPVLSNHQEALALPDSAKEALAFALLAWANRLALPNNVPSCTGASQAVVLGKLSWP
jgi:anhydro-N-acetylmuramic acid kinase